ncbi:MAG: hypothetical protein ABI795_07285 [Chthoniobacterales bacterium]
MGRAAGEENNEAHSRHEIQRIRCKDSRKLDLSDAAGGHQVIGMGVVDAGGMMFT